MKKLNLFFFAGLLLQGSFELSAVIGCATTLEYKNKRVSFFGDFHAIAKGEEALESKQKLAFVARSLTALNPILVEDMDGLLVSKGRSEEVATGLIPDKDLRLNENLPLQKVYYGSPMRGLSLCFNFKNIEFREEGGLAFYPEIAKKVSSGMNPKSPFVSVYKPACLTYEKTAKVIAVMDSFPGLMFRANNDLFDANLCQNIETILKKEGDQHVSVLAGQGHVEPLVAKFTKLGYREVEKIGESVTVTGEIDPKTGEEIVVYNRPTVVTPEQIVSMGISRKDRFGANYLRDAFDPRKFFSKS